MLPIALQGQPNKMAAPVKPWERTGVNFQHNTHAVSPPVNSMSSPLGQDNVSAAAQGPMSASGGLSNSSSPPQVPPRPSQQSSLASRMSPGFGYGSYGGGYSGGYSNPMGLGGYGGMYSSPYSSLGGYSSYGGYGYNRVNMDMGSSFARHAEESSRPAFESIESIVQAVNSVGMMLDSTFQAVYNSFRAVIGVADNFTRLKSQLVQVFSALAFIRTLRYLFRRLLELLHLRPKGEAARQWTEAFNQAAAMSPPHGGGPKRSSWPILMFFGIIMGGPYLIWKLISAFSGSHDNDGWAKGEEDHFVSKASFNFQGQGTEELSFNAGQIINIAPKELQPRVRGWLLASVDGQKVGMIPANYVTVLGKRRGSKYSSTAPLPQRQTDSGISLSQESGTTGGVTRALNSLPEQDLEGAFSDLQTTPSMSSLDPSVGLSEEAKSWDSCQKNAADILDDVDFNNS